MSGSQAVLRGLVINSSASDLRRVTVYHRAAPGTGVVPIGRRSWAAPKSEWK